MRMTGFTAEKAVDDVEEPGPEGTPQARYRVGVPGLGSREVGLGDTISRAASMVGIRPCSGCRRRAQALNAWLSFSPRR